MTKQQLIKVLFDSPEPDAYAAVLHYIRVTGVIIDIASDEPNYKTILQD